MNIKLIDLLLDDVRSTIVKHIGALGFQIVERENYNNVGRYNVRKKVKFLWGLLSCYKSIGEIRYSLSPYLNADFYSEADFKVLEPAMRSLEKDLRSRGFLDSYTTVNVMIGRNLWK